MRSPGNRLAAESNCKTARGTFQKTLAAPQRLDNYGPPYLLQLHGFFHAVF
jgi:hypothetical protein